MFLNEKRPISFKKKNKSPPNLRQIDFNNFFKTKNEITDAYTQNLRLNNQTLKQKLKIIFTKIH